MKLCRFGPVGRERPAMIDAAGQLRDLGAVISDIGADEISPAGLARLSDLDPEALPLVAGTPRFGVPFAGSRKFIAVGLNYADHAAETGADIPAEPVLFTKAISCLQGPDDPIVIPRGSTKTDWEVELGVVIGSRASYVTRAEALSYVAGYCVINDLSERAYQMERGGTWDKGKGCDTFGPVGPWLVTRDEIGDPRNLALWCEVNGARVQDGSTSTMIFDVATLVSYISEFMTLEPGDIITTGTPPGVGLGQKPEPWYLKPGDIVTLGIEGLGSQRQQCLPWTARNPVALTAS